MEGRGTKIFDRNVETEHDRVKIKGIKSYHDDSSGTRRGENVMFKFTLDKINFCHLGDLGHLLDDEIIEQLGDIDILFVPVGNVFTIGPKEAWKVINAIKPKAAIPMHYRVGGLSLSIKPIDPFLQGAEDESIVRVGNEMDFEREDLPEEFEVWVFTL